jgi:hypothetical protein
MDNRFESASERQTEDYEVRLCDRRTQLYLAEYSEHVHNIRDRVQLEQAILNYAVVLMAAFVPASIQVIDHRAFVALFLVPPIFIVMAVLALRQDLMITAIANYVHLCLAPRLRSIALDEKAFRLEESLLKLRQSKSYVPVGFARYALFCLPSVCAVIAVPYFKHKFGYRWMFADSLFALLDSLLIIFAACWIAKMASKSYLKVTGK